MISVAGKRNTRNSNLLRPVDMPGNLISLMILAVCLSMFWLHAASGPAEAYQPAPAEVSRYFRPIGEWTGRLILPDSGQRFEDGAVFIEVYTSPVSGLAGRTVPLAWDPANPWDGWFDEYRVDLVMDDKAREGARKRGFVLPDRLNGWERVSPLESLAGARREDDVEVLLKDARYQGGRILIDREPVQICGSYQVLVRFAGESSPTSREVHCYDSVAGSFSDETIWIDLPSVVKDPGVSEIPLSSVLGIENSPLNEEGWYAYGHFRGDRFIVDALESRRAVSPYPDRIISGEDRCRRFVSWDMHSDLEPGTVKRTQILPAAEAPRPWVEGERGFLVHLFGWWKSSEVDRVTGRVLGIVTGHLAFGFYEVRACPITGEPRFDLEYRQVYCHNKRGIVSGAIRGHAYMGSLNRGFMYTIPVFDTLVRTPVLDPFDFDGWQVDPYLGLGREFEKMTAIYRVGAGSGVTSVRPDVSCVQDSSCALYAGIRTFEDEIARSGIVREWVKGSPEPDEVRRFLALKRLTGRLKSGLTMFGKAQSNWKTFMKEPMAARKMNAVNVILDSLTSLKTIFPRAANDNLLRIGLSENVEMWSIVTSQVGGTIEGLRPMAATARPR